MDNIKPLLAKTLRENDYDISPQVQDQFLIYLELLQKWNQAFNLTAIRKPEDMVVLHILDSLSIHPFLHGESILDVGTGAGLPGIPLALIFPEKQFVLLDSNNKKIRFLTQVKQTLGLTNITLVHERCENFHAEKGFDTIVSRAFSSIKIMLDHTKQLIAKDGQFLAMKGVYPKEELAEIPKNFKVLAVHALKVKGLDAERHVVCIERAG